MKKQGDKVRIQVAIDEKVALKAREPGLNFSKILENALKDYIRRLEGSYCQNREVSEP
ncbi:MAG: type II toxin-antitoxin system CcdA family antitoxin [Candidatus Bathyarchaeia archaeon]